MKATSHHIQVAKTARWFQLGSLSKSTTQLVIALHGYSQSAEFFVRKFRPIASEERCIIAPEGLHRFYLGGHAGRVGASWMTKVDREADIIDYCNYLDQLTTQLGQQAPNAELHVIGFSQGAATAVRWTTRSSLAIKRLVLWAGSFPPDVDLGKYQARLSSLNIKLLIGDEDEFISQPDIVHVKDLLEKAKIPFQLDTFKGKHDVIETPLYQLFSPIAGSLD